MVYRDIVERHDAMHPQAVMDLAFRLVNNVAASHSVNSLTGYLKALNHKVSKTFVGECLEWLEDAFFLFPVKIWDASLARQNVNAKKVYCIDHALVTSVSSGILVNSGHLLENLVFLQLRRQTERIHYYRTQSGREVDFIWQDAEGKRRLVQVCETLAAKPETERRELTALTEAMQEMKLKEGTIVTRNESQEVVTPAGRITVLPAWKFLLAG
jgi:predicted AAA+ superfamily ATPase